MDGTKSGAQQRSHAHGDGLQKISAFMARHHIAGLPRNFELVYEAFGGHMPELTRELVALGSNPSQNALDQLGLKHRLAGHCGHSADRLQGEATATLGRIRDQISLGLTQKRSFSRSVEMIIKAIKHDTSHDIDQVLAELDFLSSIAGEMVQAETLLTHDIANGIDALAAADRAATAARNLAMKDRLTGLPNRLDFAQKIEEIYGKGSQQSAALIVIEVTNLMAIQQHFGDEATGRILKKLAAIFRKTIKKHDYVARIDVATFGFLFTDVSGSDAHVIAERLYAATEDNLVFAADAHHEAGGLSLAIGHTMSVEANDGAQLMALVENAVQAARKNPRQPIIAKRSGAKTA